MIVEIRPGLKEINIKTNPKGGIDSPLSPVEDTTGAISDCSEIVLSINTA